MHNVRCMRLKMSARDGELPAKLERLRSTVAEAKEALGKRRAMVCLVERGLASGGHIPDWRPDVVALVCGAITHDAHHRGQICHWASQLGAPLTPEQQLQMWEWDKRWKEIEREWAGASERKHRIQPSFSQCRSNLHAEADGH